MNTETYECEYTRNADSLNFISISFPYNADVVLRNSTGMNFNAKIEVTVSQQATVTDPSFFGVFETEEVIIIRALNRLAISSKFVVFIPKGITVYLSGHALIADEEEKEHYEQKALQWSKTSATGEPPHGQSLHANGHFGVIMARLWSVGGDHTQAAMYFTGKYHAIDVDTGTICIDKAECRSICITSCVIIDIKDSTATEQFMIFGNNNPESRTLKKIEPDAIHARGDDRVSKFTIENVTIKKGVMGLGNAILRLSGLKGDMIFRMCDFATLKIRNPRGKYTIQKHGADQLRDVRVEVLVTFENEFVSEKEKSEQGDVYRIKSAEFEVLIDDTEEIEKTLTFTTCSS